MKAAGQRAGQPFPQLISISPAACPKHQISSGQQQKKFSCAGPLEVLSLPSRYHEAELSSSQVNIVQKATPELRLGTPHLPETWWVVETIICGTLCWWGQVAPEGASLG